MALAAKPQQNHTFTGQTDSEPLIIAQDLAVQYEGEKEKGTDYKSLIHNAMSFKRESKFESVWALNGVSFSAYPGDVLGIIGDNGAGKTTLCRAILGLMKPDRGSINVRGEVTSMLSLGTGFNNEISGRENIILNGLMLGLSREKLNYLLPSIEEFTGLGRFLEHPIKLYSNGMRARLGFSIAAALDPDILVIDEVLGTGDLSFKDRAVTRMNELVSGAKMVVVVTHDISFVEKNCNRALWLDQGRVVTIGESSTVASAYREQVSERAKPAKKVLNIRETRTEKGSHKTIKVKNLGVKFKLGREPFWALKNVSFNANDKEIIGLIGPNGAGKTTLCRTLSGLYQPDQGSIKVKGDISALLSFNLGFNPLLTGRDNIYLNGMMLGIAKKEIRKLEKDIIEFSELEKVIHKPVRQYSSGMKSRLGFSIAAMLKPDLFIVDEALSAGDIAFREKATERMQDMLEDAKTVVLVTHSLNIVEKACTRAIWLQQGNIRYDGDPKKAVALYREAVMGDQKIENAMLKNKDTRLQHAVKKLRGTEYKIAEELLKEYLTENPSDLAVLIKYAEIAELCDDKQVAKERWLKAHQAAECYEENIPDEIEKILNNAKKKYV